MRDEEFEEFQKRRKYGDEDKMTQRNLQLSTTGLTTADIHSF
jgi:hypothetical protein